MRRVPGNAVPVSKMLVLSITLVLIAGVASADEILTFQPDPVDLYDLPHGKCFTWGIGVPGDFTTEPVTSAMLTFTNIENWDDSRNQLYVHLLDHTPLGVRSHNDGWGDAFSGQGVLLVEYFNLPPTADNLVYNFSIGEVAVLNGYLLNGNNMALGVDPDCHFYNDGVSLELTRTTSHTPEPSTTALVGTAVLGLIGFIKRKRMA